MIGIVVCVLDGDGAASIEDKINKNCLRWFGV